MKHLEHLPKLLLVLLFLKGLFLGFDTGSCVVTGILALLIAFYEYKIKDIKIDELDKAIKTLQESSTLNQERISKLNDSLSGFKLSQGMKAKF